MKILIALCTYNVAKYLRRQLESLCALTLKTDEVIACDDNSSDNTVIYYQLSNYFMPDCYAGLRWNDSKIGICWYDNRNIVINERDKNYGLL